MGCNMMKSKRYNFNELVKHMKVCTNLQFYCPHVLCPIYGGFDTIFELQIHLESHCEFTKLRCTRCHYKFNRKNICEEVNNHTFNKCADKINDNYRDAGYRKGRLLYKLEHFEELSEARREEESQNASK